MNKISLICPQCGDYGNLSHNGLHRGYYVECCGRWLLDGNGKSVEDQDALIRVLKSGTWKLGWIIPEK